MIKWIKPSSILSLSLLQNYSNYFVNSAIFRKNEEVNVIVSTLSGGEKALLSLAQIVAQTPKLLILDEITNNLDLETKKYVVQVLQAYPGAMIVILHDDDFLEEIRINDMVNVEKFNHNQIQHRKL